jgi:hypothetical protein
VTQGADDGLGPEAWSAPQLPESGPVRGIRVRCDRCGPRVVAVSALRLLGRTDRWEYAFTCPDCEARTRRAADSALRAVLLGAGAAELSVQTPHTPHAPWSQSG